MTRSSRSKPRNAGLDGGSARIGRETGADVDELLADHREEPVGVFQDLDETLHSFNELLVLIDDLVLLEPGQAVEAHVEDGLGLGRGKAVRIPPPPVRGVGPLDAESLLVLGPGEVGAVLEQGDDHPGSQRRAINPARASAGLAEARMSSITGSMFARATASPSRTCARARARLSSKIVRRVTTLAPVTDEAPDDLLQIEGPRLAVDEGHHVDAEHRLELGVPVEPVQEHLRNRVPAHLGHDPDPVLVRLVAKLGDALDLAGTDELGDLFDEPRLVHLVGDFGEHHPRALVALPLLHVGRRPQMDSPAPV